MRPLLCAVLVLALGGTGCSFNNSLLTLNPSLAMDSYSINDRRDGTFQLNISPSKYQELTDAGPQDVRAFVNGALLRKRLCQAGYTTDEPVSNWGHVAITGRCNPTG